MGELSATHLRGDSMADVIFNGSASRKPVGTASVELVFDNADGKIGGAYASYSEVSLKRVVSRDGSFELLHQRRPLPPQGHHPAVPRHRPGLAQLRDHRAGHDLARHRGARRRHARLRRGGRRHFALQGAPPRDRRRASATRARTWSACRTCATRSTSRSATCSARRPPRAATRTLQGAGAPAAGRIAGAAAARDRQRRRGAR